MKKLTAILMAILMVFSLGTAAFALDAEEIIGTWYLESMLEDGELLEASSVGIEYVLDIREDGTFNISMETFDISFDGEWKLDGDDLELSVEGDPIAAYLKDGVLTLDSGDGTCMNFTRNRNLEERIVLGKIVEEPELEDFNGTWNAVAVEVMGMYVSATAVDIEMKVTVEDGKADIHFATGGESVDAEAVPVEIVDGALILSDSKDVEDMTGIFIGYNDFSFRVDENGIMIIGDIPSDEAAEEAESVFMGITVYFEKQIVLGEVKKDAVMEDFEGAWKAKYVDINGEYKTAADAEFNLGFSVNNGEVSMSFNGEEIEVDEAEIVDGKLNIVFGVQELAFSIDENGIVFISDDTNGENVTAYFVRTDLKPAEAK